MELGTDQKVQIAAAALEGVIAAKPELIESHPAKLVAAAVALAREMVGQLKTNPL